MDNCQYEECVFTGYTCKNNKCVCDPDEPAFFRCVPPKSHGEPCNSDQECHLSDYNLYCVKGSDARMCKCKRSYVWDAERRKCLPTADDDVYIGRFDPVRELVIPVIIVVTIGAMVYLGLKLFCNCGKLWRRRRHQEIARELEEMSATPHQPATWIASYRVFSPYGGSSSNSSSSARPPPGIFVPSQLSTSPPSYEEALKHKVILSSYHPAAYALPPEHAPRHYHTLPANASAAALDAARRSAAPQVDAWSHHHHHHLYAAAPVASPAPPHPFAAGSAGHAWSPRAAELGVAHGDADLVVRGHAVEVRPRDPAQPPSVAQQVEAQSRASTFRPTQPARVYHGNVPEPSRGGGDVDR